MSLNRLSSVQEKENEQKRQNSKDEQKQFDSFLRDSDMQWSRGDRMRDTTQTLKERAKKEHDVMIKESFLES